MPSPRFNPPFVSRGQPLWGLGQQRRDSGLLELSSLEDVGARTAPTNSVANASTGFRHDANDADVQRHGDEPLSRRRGDASSPATRLLASLPVPLLPPHTLDLSLRTDLGSLEDSLSRWAAAGLLHCLRRLSLIECRQLQHLRWLSDMPADSLEVLNISGCDALLHLRPMWRLSSLRQLKAAQLYQLGRLGWWGNAANVDTSLTGRTTGGDSVCD